MLSTTIVFAISCCASVASNMAVAGTGVDPDYGACPPEVHWSVNTYQNKETQRGKRDESGS